MTSKCKLEIYSDCKDGGKLQKNTTSTIVDFLLKNIGKRLHIVIEVVKNTRSHRQNRYYWGCVIQEQIDCFHERLGEIWDKDEMHDWNKSNIWHTTSINERTGELINRPGSSKTKTVGEFEERMEKLRQKFELDWEWKIPLPNENLELDF
ncbi:MAG: hypothetical protein V4538_16140 [Bacteroidota bacterium]